MSRTSRRRTPVHFALPTSLPPTSLLTHEIVTYCSNIGQRDELLPGQRRLAVDQAVDLERPAGGVDDRRQQRGVDPVEPVVGHDDRGQARDRRGEVLGRVERRDRHRRGRDRRDRRRPARRAGARAATRPTISGGHGPDTDRAGPDQERAARPVGHRGGAPAGRHPPGRAVEQPRQDPQPGPDRDGRRGRRDARAGERVVERGEEADDTEDDEDARRDLEPTSREQAETGADDAARRRR